MILEEGDMDGLVVGLGDDALSSLFGPRESILEPI